MDGTTLLAFAWHQRRSSIETRERLLGVLSADDASLVLATCHRVELYAAVGETEGATDVAAARGVAAELGLATVLTGPRALAHLFAVAAGLDSAIAGEPQILSQVRRAYAGRPSLHPLLVAAFSRASHVGRAVRAAAGLTAARSVGSIAVDRVVAGLADPAASCVLVVGAGEMGKLAVRALSRRVGRVVVANRDRERAAALAASYGATAVGLDEVPAALGGANAVISAADTRGALLTAPLLARRLADRRPLTIVDIAVPRSVDAAARELAGARYVSVDDLPGAAVTVPPAALAAALARCEAEAEAFFAARDPARVEAIRALRGSAERVRDAKLARALRRLGHLSEEDRRAVEALAASLTNALLHAPTVAVRERRLDPNGVRALVDGTPR